MLNYCIEYNTTAFLSAFLSSLKLFVAASQAANLLRIYLTLKH